MSLVALKNSFLPNRGYQTLPQDQRRRSNEPQGSVIRRTLQAAAANASLDSQESGSSSDTDDEDVESQTTHVRSRSSSSSTYPAAEDADGDEDRRRECREASVNSGSSNGRGFRISARLLSDATIGLSDGLTVPFALTAGLSAFGETRVVVFGGLAELIAGAISMGLGGYLGAKSEMYVL